MQNAAGCACDVVIVGAGAAGLATAIFARRAAPALHVVVLEGARRPGAKILISGGSRCNVTNRHVAEQDFWGGRRTIVRRVLKAFPVVETVAFFRGLGVALHEEANGKLFPDSNRSRDVLEALLREAARGGVDLRLGARVESIDRDDGGGFRVAANGTTVWCRAIVLATGGRSLPKTGSDGTGWTFAERLGHSIVPTTPGLAPLVLADDASSIHASLQGVAHEAALSVWAGERVAIRLRGALLWTHFGISGPVALDASRHWARAQNDGLSPRIAVNFCPDALFEDLDQTLIGLAHTRSRASVGAALGGLLPGAVVATLLERLGIPADQQMARLARDDRRRVIRGLVEWPLDVVATRGYDYAEVTAGGVTLTEIDPSTMASRVCPGLYLVGEILDVDGRLGGFNFQWAWSTGKVAGTALATAPPPEPRRAPPPGPPGSDLDFRNAAPTAPGSDLDFRNPTKD